MKWRETARLTGAVLAAAGVCAFVAHPAAAQGKNIERRLAGIRLNASSKAVLAAYGNPNEVVIGDVGPRTGGTATGGAGAGASGAPTGFSGPGAGMARGGGGKSSMGSAPAGPTSSSVGGGGSPGGPPPGFTPSGPPPGFGGPPPGFGGAPSGVGGGESDPGGFGGGSGTQPSATGFGQTTSTLARQQEVTWIYNRRYKDNLITYQFLIGPNGNVSQITVIGYNSSGGNVATQKGIGLGRTYRDVVRAYGFPEEHYRVGGVLVASYRRTAHVAFQFKIEGNQSNPLNSGNKCFAITIATVE